jgi:hypothetical protein
MQEIFKALSEILPRCLSSERFAAPGDREIVSAEFAKIAANADALAKHAGSAGPTSRHQGDSSRRCTPRVGSLRVGPPRRRPLRCAAPDGVVHRLSLAPAFGRRCAFRVEADRRRKARRAEQRRRIGDVTVHSAHDVAAVWDVIDWNSGKSIKA